MPPTRGFRDASNLREHFGKHGAEVGALTEAEYLSLAKRFLERPMEREDKDCIRPRDGDYIRYNAKTHEFGVIANDGFIRTYVILDPGDHAYSTNAGYFLAECAKT